MAAKHQYMVLERSEIAPGTWTEWRIQKQPTGYGGAKKSFDLTVWKLRHHGLKGWEVKIVRIEPDVSDTEKRS